MTVEPARPLVLAREPDHLDDLLRLAAAACVEVEVPPDLAAARQRWSTAPLVVVDADVAGSYVDARLPRRHHVVLVGRDADAASDDGALWQLAADLGAEHVVFLPAAEPWLVDRYTAAGGPARHGVVVGVVGGRGGAGASVLAAALAVTAVRQGSRTLLIDADPLGGGLDLLLGRENSAGLRWPDLADTAGRVHPAELYDALPRVGELCVLSWDRGDLLTVPAAAVEAALDAGRRGSDVVVVDLPRRPDEAAVRALQAADTTLLVVPAEVRACAAAGRVAAAIGPHSARLRCVVRGPAPAGLRSRDLARALRLPLAGILRAEPGLAAALERGDAPAADGRGPLADLCRQVLADLDTHLRAA